MSFEVKARLLILLDGYVEQQAQMIKSALTLAEEVHAGAYRKPRKGADQADPYIVHPIRVALILTEELGINDSDMIIAALLHDVVEDSGGSVTIASIRTRFGATVADMVNTLTKPSSSDVPKQMQLDSYYKALLAAPEKTRKVKLADRLDNIREALLTSDVAFQRRYLAETVSYYLPMALATDSYLYSQIKDACERLSLLLDMA
ncbi:MAG: HD domain-containing protein [Acidobacteriota bacterium]|nr:HD domain-containing protein [Blastocatellia bacterium]MDW8413178.1 HD domain-containing protein [Acidobacteriota bacterium]